MKLLKIVFIISFVFNCLSEAKQESYKILIFQSYHETLPWSNQFLKGVNEFNNKHKEEVELFLESIDYLRLKNQMTPKKWEEYLKNKYKDLKFDGIIIESAFASGVFQKFSNNFYLNTPKIYITNIDIKKSKNIAVYNGFDNELAIKSIKLIKKHNPKLKNIYLIKTKNPIALNIEKMVLKELKKTNLKIIILDNFSIEELKIKLSNLPENSAVISTVNLEDNTGKHFFPKKFLEEISQNSSAPIYDFWSSLLGSGIIGGYMNDGNIIAQTSLENLLHFIKEGNFLKSQSIYRTFIDYNILKKYNIDENSNPQNTIFINKPVPVWKTYPKESFFAICLILLLVMLLLLSIVLKIRNEKIKRMEETIFLQSRQAVMGEMLSVIAHQWRQPLNTISAMVQTIIIKYMKNNLTTQIMEKFKKEIINQIKYMSHTIDDFRNFYKPNREKVDFNIKEELEKTIELIEAAYVTNGIKIEKLNLKDFQIKGYSNELEQCFLILLQNSKDSLCNILDKKNKYIKISMETTNNICTLTFEDNGTGIKNGVIDKIFTPYFSTKDINSGTGIGLYMAKIIIEKHFNGVIEASNTQDGAKFKIRFFNDK